MLVHSLSPCITTTKIEASRDFYVQHLGAKVTFDCNWYVMLELGTHAGLQLMAVQPDQPVCNPAGLMYNLAVADVDAEYQRLTAAGLQLFMPLEDHPWGDRGFAIQDPNGVVLYIFSQRPPSPEFQQYYKP